MKAGGRRVADVVSVVLVDAGKGISSGDLSSLKPFRSHEELSSSNLKPGVEIHSDIINHLTVDAQRKLRLSNDLHWFYVGQSTRLKVAISVKGFIIMW